MVSWKPQGRLGNWLFQAATSYAYAKKHDLPWTVPSRTNDKFWNPLYFLDLAKPMPIKHNRIIQERGHQFQELPFEEWWRDDNIILEGYFQSEKYFKDCREDILRMFNPTWDLEKDICSIHIRLGDYKMYPNKHPMVTKAFYREAVRRIMRKGCNRFKIFSDEIHAAGRIIEEALHIYFDIELVEFVSGNDELTDLRLISQCQHHINSSSTFSWWGAWLNPDPAKIIITPELWFVPGHGGLDTKDIIPESWIKLPN